MAKKNDKNDKKKKMTAEEKAAKRKARMEAIKNRPAIQRPNSKQIDVIEGVDTVIENYGYAIKSKKTYVGVLVTSVVKDKEGHILNSSVTFVPGKLTVKSKKNHGTICSPKEKKVVDDDVNDEAEDDQDVEDSED